MILLVCRGAIASLLAELRAIAQRRLLDREQSDRGEERIRRCGRKPVKGCPQADAPGHPSHQQDLSTAVPN